MRSFRPIPLVRNSKYFFSIKHFVHLKNSDGSLPLSNVESHSGQQTHIHRATPRAITLRIQPSCNPKPLLPVNIWHRTGCGFHAPFILC